MAIDQTKVTDSNPFGGGAPTLEERAEKVHWNAAKRIQTSMGKGTKKAEDILRWRLEQIHKSMDPKNKRKTEEVWVKNTNSTSLNPIVKTILFTSSKLKVSMIQTASKKIPLLLPLLNI